MADFDIRDLAKGLATLNKLASSAKITADTGNYLGDFVKDNDKMIENLLKYQSGTSIGRETLRFYAWVKDRRKKKKTFVNFLWINCHSHHHVALHILLFLFSTFVSTLFFGTSGFVSFFL